jgi:hypothetical protein
MQAKPHCEAFSTSCIYRVRRFSVRRRDDFRRSIEVVDAS